MVGCLPWSGSRRAVQTQLGSPRDIKESQNAAASSPKSLKQKLKEHNTFIMKLSRRRKLISDNLSVNDFLTSSKTAALNECFGNLSKRFVNFCVNALEVEHIKAGTVFVHRGDESKYVFILASGDVRLYMNARNGNGNENRNELKQVQVGEIFGESDFILDLPARTEMKVHAQSPSCVLKLGRETYLKYHRETWLRPFSDYIVDSGICVIARCLEGVNFFSTLDEEQLLTAASLFRAIHARKDDVIIKEGDKGDSLLVLSNGEVVVTTKAVEGSFAVEITRMSPGCVFGELSLVKEDHHRLATVIASRDSVLFELRRDRFAEFLETAEHIHTKLERAINTQSAIVNVAKNIPFFESVAAHKLHLLRTVSYVKRYANGTTLLRQGGQNDTFYILQEGELQLFIDDVLVETIMKKGTYFGEMSLLSNEGTASATIKVSSSEGAACFECSRKDFKALFLTEPGVLAEIEMRLLGNKSELRHILSHPKSKEVFVKHCEKEYASENVEFWLSVKKFRSLESQLNQAFLSKEAKAATRKKLLEKYGKLIYEKFVANNSNQMINIDSQERSELIKAFESGKLDFSMFNRAQQEIYALMQTDNYSRFKESITFHKLLSSLNLYKRMSKRKVNIMQEHILPISRQAMSSSLNESNSLSGAKILEHRASVF